jgi:glycogen debranching enzyme
MHFAHYRLPEVFAGFRKQDYDLPVHYPVACHPQAWAAGAVPYLLESSLGLEPEAFEHRLRIVQPVLPDFIRHIEICHLKVGNGSADLRFARDSEDKISVEVLHVEGKLDVVIEG